MVVDDETPEKWAPLVQPETVDETMTLKVSVHPAFSIQHPVIIISSSFQLIHDVTGVSRRTNLGFDFVFLDCTTHFVKDYTHVQSRAVSGKRGQGTRRSTLSCIKRRSSRVRFRLLFVAALAPLEDLTDKLALVLG